MDERILDSINIKTYPELIINFLKENKINSNFNNLRSFYNNLLSSINDDIRDSYLNRILKYLSSKEASNILILDDIGNDIYTKELHSFFELVSKDINKSNNKLLFYKKLIDLCSYIYFSKEEVLIIKEIYDSKDYSAMLYELFVHACLNYKTNTPKILAERLFQEAICLEQNNIMRKLILKMAADLGNDWACHTYATIVYDDFIERFNYYLKGKNNACSLWELAFIIEHYELNKDQYIMAIKDLKDVLKIANDTFKDKYIVKNAKNEFENDCTLLAFKLYLYLSHIKNFSKAYCSVGKFFFTHKIVIIDSNGNMKENDTLNYAFDYSYKAIKLGNIFAMGNVAAYYYDKKDEKLFDYKDYFKVGASVKYISASEYLIKILMEENNTEEAEKYLQFIANNNYGEAQFKLAKLYETKMKYDEAINYYEKAINNNIYKASIDLAKIYFNKYMSQLNKNNSKNGYLLLAINLINSHYNNYNDEERKEADYLLKTFKSLL